MGEMTTYDAYLELQPDGACLAQIVDLPGCFARGPAESAALSTLVAAIPPYYDWLSRHDDYTPIVAGPFHVDVRERLAGTADPCAAGAFFAPDALPATKDDLDWLLSLVEWANADLLALAEGGHLVGGDAILKHVAEVQVGKMAATMLRAGRGVYATSILGADGVNALRQVGPWLRASVEGATEEELAVQETPDGQGCSVRWALRLAIVHARAHASV